MRTGGEINYDYWCLECRYSSKYIPPSQLRARFQAGLITEYKYKSELARREDTKKETRAKNIVKHGKYGEVKKMQSWDRVERSTKVMREFLKKVHPENEAAEEWLEQTVQILDEAVAYIAVEKEKRFFERKDAVFWYDVSPELRVRVREHVKNYPGDNCPLIVL